MTGTTYKTALRLGLTSAMAAVLLTGCAGGPLARSEASQPGVTAELAHANEAVTAAEAAVAASPHDAALRLALGDAYLDAGRFASAETTFTDAMDLGETSPRAALSLALAQIAQAKYPEATNLLDTWGSEIAKADLGLAMALAGQPERGIHIMSNAIRAGENTVKMRQNLAYAFAIAGRWREARLMAQQDLPAGEVNARLEEWAKLASADAYQQRVAGLLGAPTNVADAGQPIELALSSARSAPQYAEVESFPTAVYEGAELAALGDVPALSSTANRAALAPSSTFATVFSDIEPEQSTIERAVAADSLTFVSNPVVQQTMAPAEATRPAAAPHRASAQRLAAPAGSPLAISTSEATHLVQLGSFTSEAGARRAWQIYLSRFPQLADHDMVITQANVRGKRYWRVSADGFDQRASSSMCRNLRSAGAECISWASNSPLPGATQTQLARR